MNRHTEELIKQHSVTFISFPLLSYIQRTMSKTCSDTYNKPKNYSTTTPFCMKWKKIKMPCTQSYSSIDKNCYDREKTHIETHFLSSNYSQINLTRMFWIPSPHSILNSISHTIIINKIHTYCLTVFQITNKTE